MHPTFTGNSRRPRNVNLSGQKSVNPFTAGGWTPSGSQGTSHSIAHAQADRRQRQQERDRLRASQTIQRTWRGYRARRQLQDSRRRAFDKLFDMTVPPNCPMTTGKALALIVAFFDQRNTADALRLSRVARDLEQINYSSLSSLSRPVRLFEIVTSLLRQHLYVKSTR